MTNRSVQNENLDCSTASAVEGVLPLAGPKVRSEQPSPVSAIRDYLNRGEVFQANLSTLVMASLADAQTQVGEALSRKWIRNASRRIFSDPHRFLLELVVNGIDACVPITENRGQFGMGFLSCLEFLNHEDTQGTTIVLESKCATESFRQTFSGNPDNPTITFHATENTTGKTGTVLSILPTSKNFSEHTLSAMKQILFALDLQNDAAIDIIFAEKGGVTTDRIGRPSGIAEVTVELSSGRIIIADRGSGIPLDTAATALLVPGGSTKPRTKGGSEVVPAELVRWRGSPNEQSVLLIVIGGVVVVSKRIALSDRALNVTQNGTSPRDVVIRMPPQTRITLDRDECIIDRNPIAPDKLSQEEEYLRNVIDVTLARYFSKKVDPEAALYEAQIIGVLYDGLYSWEASSDAAYLSTHPISGYLKERVQHLLSEDSKLIPVSQHYYRYLCEILNDKLDGFVIPLPANLANFDYSRADKVIPKVLEPTASDHLGVSAFEGHLIDGKSVIFIDDRLLPTPTGCSKPAISALGLANTLFVPNSLRIAENDDLRSVQEAILYTYAEPGSILRPATSRQKSPHEGILDRTLLVTNARPERLDYCSYGMPYSHGCPDQTLCESLYRTYRVFDETHTPALRRFWEEYRIYELQSGSKSLCSAQFDSNLASRHSVVSDIYYAILSSIEAKTSKREVFCHAIRGNWLMINESEHLVTLNSEKLYNLFAPLIEQFQTKERFLETYDYDKMGQLVESYLATRSDWFQSHDPMPFLNYLFFDLMAKHRLISADPIWEVHRALVPKELQHQDRRKGKQRIVPEKPYLQFGREVIWPLPDSASSIDIAKLFGALLICNIDGPYNGLHTMKKRDMLALPFEAHLPGMREIIGAKFKVAAIYLPTKSTIEQAKEVAAGSREASHFVGVQLYMQSAIEGFSALRSVVGGLGFCDFLGVTATSGSAPSFVADQLQRLKRTVSYLMRRYLDLPDGSLSGGYDKTQMRSAGDSSFGIVDTDTVVNFCQKFAGGSALFKKLIDFQISNASSILSLEAREFDIQKGALSDGYHCAGPSTPIGKLSSLKELGVADNHINTILEVCASHLELNMSAHLILKAIQVEHKDNYREDRQTTLFGVRDAATTARISAAISAFVTLVVRERLGDYGSFLHEQSLTAELKNTCDSAVSGEGSFRTIRQTGNNESELAILNAPHFSLTQLVGCHLQDARLMEHLTSGQFGCAIDLICASGEINIQNKVTNNVESASERSGIQSSILESIQNATDALRSMKWDGFESRLSNRSPEIQVEVCLLQSACNQTDRLQYSLGRFDSQSSASLCIEIKDTAGFPDLKTILSDLLLPDYSNKSGIHGNVGDMGNGLFQLYRDADEVRFTTRLTLDPNQAFLLSVIPVRTEDTGQVEDLNIRCARLPLADLPGGTSFYGTSVHIRFRERSAKNAYADAIIARHYIRSTLGAYRAFYSPGRIIPLFLSESHKGSMRLGQVNSRSENDTALISEYVIPIGSDTAHLRILRSLSEGHISQVTTGGIPATNLRRFCDEQQLLPRNLLPYIEHNLILELPVGSYQPVQSRSDIRLNADASEMLRSALLDAVMVQALSEETSKKPNKLACFQHGETKYTRLEAVDILPRANFKHEVMEAIRGGKDISVIQLCTHHSPWCLQNKRLATFAQIVHELTADILVRIDPILKEAGEFSAICAIQLAVATKTKDTATLSELHGLIAEFERKARTSISKIFDDCFRAHRMELVDATNQNTSFLEIILDQCVYNWFANKMATYPMGLSTLQLATSSRSTLVVNDPNKDFPEVGEELHLATRLFEQISQNYLEEFGRRIDSSLSPPSFRLDVKPDFSGFYNRSENQIGLNPLGSVEFGDLLTLMTKLKGSSLLTEDEGFIELGYSLPSRAGILVHELEHWRRQHDDGELHPGWLTEDGRWVDFEGSAIIHWRRSVNDGALLAWIRNSREAILKSKVPVEVALAQWLKLSGFGKLHSLRILGVEG